MDFLLTTPEQHGFQDPTLELDENRLGRWLESLPLLNCGESARLVLDALQPLNEQRLDTDKRLRLLASGRVDVVPLVTATFPFKEAPEAVAYAMNRTGLKAIVTFAEDER